MIQTFNLTKNYYLKDETITAVNNLSIKVNQGQVVGLFGPNGAGKTTTVRLLSTIIRPTTGDATVAGYNIYDNPLEVRKSIGLSTEAPSLYERLTARRNLKFHADLYEIPKMEFEKRMVKLIREFDLVDALDRPVGTFSKGMKQKLSLVKALLHEPSVLILDEPWSGLSPEASLELRNRISNLATDDKMTILISTHNLSQAESIVDEFLIISNGALIAQSTSEELHSKFSVNSEVLLNCNNNSIPEDKILTADYVLGIRKSEEKEQEFHIEVSSFDYTPKLVQSLVSLGIDIRGITEIVPSLEEVYLSLVGGNEA